MFPRPLRLSLSIALATPLLLAGCFDEQRDTTSSEDGERISLAMLQPPRSGLTPLSDDAFKLSRWSTAETLIRLDASSDPQPFLATEWEQLDGHTWRFVIRDGVSFHDGTTLTVSDVVNALTAATQAAPKPRILDGVNMTIEADGDNAVIVRTATNDPLIPNRLSSPQLAILAASAYGEDGRVNPIKAGTGPFVLTEINGTSSAHLDRFDDYWGEPAKVAGIDADYVPDGTARAAALRTGAADVIEAIPVSQVALLDPERVHEVPMPRTNTLYLNTESGPMTDPGLRAAVRDAIDRSAIVNTVYEGRADIAEGLLGPALAWASDYRAPLEDRTTPTAPNGTDITLATFTDRAELPEVAVLLEQQLTRAGFNVNQEVREYAHIEADALAGEFDAFILSRATVLDSGDPVAYMFSDFACAGSFNIAQLCDPAADEALANAAMLPTGDERRQAIIEAEAAILRTDAAIPMLHERVIQGESARVSNAERDPRERALITEQTTIDVDSDS
ncbi:MAG TPA: ABC transporter substrate-binding protein [Halomonas campaniensis]|uniref:ABC transporter substrate-binding protein n=1 Tax=Halomonas campaniensis TaxID=213554 RepID=A0A3D0KKR4_9GAMM|nr:MULTISPECIES: ABC transporter substrate-binding protein [unclassified Halomonas]HBS84479.1 ABC transporter substrate-binding protein [Halomonas campaniensis]HCA04147.1 ABC transporter substrate-binding protein [Halomonas campaniensis]